MQAESATPSTGTALPKGTAVRQLSVFMPNRVGVLMSLVKLLQDHSIEVLGLSVEDLIEMTLFRLVVSDPDSAEMIFIEKGIPHTTCPLLVVELKESQHRLTDCLAALLAAELNVEFAYSMLMRPGMFPLVAFHLDDTEIGYNVLHRAGFRVLAQEDLSR